MKLREGNVFTGMSQSFCSQGGKIGHHWSQVPACSLVPCPFGGKVTLVPCSFWGVGYPGGRITGGVGCTGVGYPRKDSILKGVGYLGGRIFRGRVSGVGYPAGGRVYKRGGMHLTGMLYCVLCI